MRRLRIDICNERLLPRFGVDRLLILLARRLVDQGHQVGFVCLRCDRPMLEPISSDITVIDLPPGLDMARTEQSAEAALTPRWNASPPDVVVIGGWPFFQTASRSMKWGVRSLFIDAGAVAQDGLPEPLLSMQRELRRIRRLTLPFIDRVLSISDFIRFSQSEPDRGGESGIRTVLLGADHVELGHFRAVSGLAETDILARLDALVAANAKLLLCLGRFEAQGYKNSPAAYDVLRIASRDIGGLKLLLLDAGEDCRIPEDLADQVVRLGAPDDQTLQQIMRRCAVGISTSLWEGFNLPIAEMHWLERPAVAFNLGAHPEVIADPWLLCADTAEMAAKTVALLSGRAPSHLDAAIREFRRHYRWERTLDEWEAEITSLAGSVAPRRVAPRLIVVDVTNAARDPANPGVIRVVRRLCAELLQHLDLELVFAAWDGGAGGYGFLDATRREFLQAYGGPRDGLSMLAAASFDTAGPGGFVDLASASRVEPPVLFLPEVIFDGEIEQRISWAAAHGCRVAALLHDLIPYDHPEWCDPHIVAEFPGYLKALSRLDGVWSNSEHTRTRFREFLTREALAMPEVGDAVWLPGQFAASERIISAAAAADEIRILCVSTLEPRKNHQSLLDGFQRLRARRPDLPVRLILVGNRYAGAPEIAAAVEAAALRDDRICWLGILSDEALAEQFRAAAFTVYPSLAEGFGLPILEAIWMGRPCLTHEAGVMLELARGGGCLPVDMTRPDAIADALERLATDERLRAILSDEVIRRPITTWSDYADAIAKGLVKL